jgi:hypothetical protein
MSDEELPPIRLPFPVTRAVATPVEFRAADGEAPKMRGRFTTFDDPYEVNSHIEGRFLETMAPGAFDRTVVESRKNIKVLFNHGQDPTMGDQIMGSIEELRGSGDFTVEPFDGIPPLIRSGLEAEVYGASHRFSVISDVWDYKPARSDSNPDRIPERLITEARLYEFGPVTFPANPNATAGIRSTTDDFYRAGTDAYESVLRSAQQARAGSPQTDAGLPRSPVPDAPPVPPIEADTRSMNMDGPILSIEDKRARVAELTDGMARTAESIAGPLPEEEQVRWNTDVDERARLIADIEAYDARQAQIADAVTRGNVERPWKPAAGNGPAIIRKSEAELHSHETRASSYQGAMAEYRDDAMRLLEKTHFAYGLADQERSADKVVDLLDNHDSPDKELARRIKYTSAPAYASAFHKFITSRGSTIGFTAEEQRGTALAVGVDATGGFAVPFAFDPTVIAIGVNNGAVNPYRRACRVVSIVGTDTWNALTATAVVATRTTEAAASVEQGPTFAQPQYIVTRAQGQITASFEMFQDRSDLASELSALIQEAKDNEEETSMATGATAAANIGVGPVSGTSGAYTAVAGAGSGVLAEGDFTATEAALPVRHRFNAQWFANRVNIRKAQSLETTGGKLFGGSQYPSVGNVAVDGAGNTGLRLLGYPVNESPSLPTATTTTITAMTLVNVNSYVIVDRIGLSVQFIPFIFNSSALATGQQALYFLYRNTAKPINVDAGRTLRFL